MTDKEYINGFYGHNDSVITNFYLSKREMLGEEPMQVSLKVSLLNMKTDYMQINSLSRNLEWMPSSLIIRTKEIIYIKMH